MQFCSDNTPAPWNVESFPFNPDTGLEPGMLRLAWRLDPLYSDPIECHNLVGARPGLQELRASRMFGPVGTSFEWDGIFRGLSCRALGSGFRR